MRKSGTLLIAALAIHERAKTATRASPPAGADVLTPRKTQILRNALGAINNANAGRTFTPDYLSAIEPGEKS